MNIISYLFKSILTIFVLILLSKIVHSQTTLFIRSSSDQSNLPFVSITDISKKISYSANETGLATINAEKGDSLLISYIGYEAQYVNVKQDDYVDTVYMVRSIKRLEEVYIKSCKQYKNYLIPTDKSHRRKGEYMAGVMCTKMNYNGKVAVRIQNGQDDGIVRSITFWLKKLFFHSTPDYAFQSPLMISFYSVSTSDLPGELLHQDPLFVFPEKEGKQKLQLDSLHIHVPAEGIFVCFEYIMDERYQWKEKTVDSTIIHQGVVIDGQHTDKPNLCFYDHRKNCWGQFWKDHPQSTRQTTIRIEAVLKYCK